MERRTTFPVLLLTPAAHQKDDYFPASDEKATVKVLIEGYARQVEEGWIASSTTCLVISSGIKIITDPGCNRQKLMEALANENLSTEEIDFIFLSHGHPDHMMLCGIFPNAKLVTYDDNLLYDQDRMVKFDKQVMGPYTEVINTPGHTSDHISLIVQTNSGTIAIAGDTFWWTEGEIQDPFNVVSSPGDDRHRAEESRRTLLKIADFIIPGHGKMFRVQKNNGL